MKQGKAAAQGKMTSWKAVQENMGNTQDTSRWKADCYSGAKKPMGPHGKKSGRKY